MRRLQKFLRLSSARRRLLVAAGLVVFFVRILLWVLPFKHLVWLVERTALRSARLAPVRLTEERNGSIAWAITTAARYALRSKCLTQALAGQWL
ncbi:MAG: lasso peptide biosynthesis B2 protein, partial [Acidobacteria bacterium]|nr:lasso peptide biosynthesis B2 protein [Acidobacteriota bacterium]